ncbi:hypothetical protein ABZ951_03715 [Streptomyces sp. NPDC046215]|uniref:Uncharacterized protein n=1 Tax=Streptomyces stramineus TaxID=173861 RepID=A0ABP3JXF0_9ACTN
MSGGIEGKDSLKTGKGALDGIAKGLNGAIEELKKIGSPGDAATGRGFSELALSGLETGHEGLTASFKAFCDRWEWGVRALVHDGSQFADRVGLAAGYYHEGEQYISNTFKVVTNAALGNPNLTEEEIEAQSWGKTLSDNPLQRDSDYSAGSFRQAAHNASETWQKTASDVKREGFGEATRDAAAEIAKKKR